MKVKTPNNKNIQPYLKPDTVYDAKPSKPDGFFEYTNHLLLNLDGTPSLGYGSLKGCLHLNGAIDWNNKKGQFDAVAKAMLQAAKELNVKITWGGNWKMVDKPHFQIEGV